MSEHNPYSTPSGELIQESQESNVPKVFDAAVRIGRVRYVARSVLATLAVYVVMGVGVGIGAVTGSDAGANIVTGVFMLIAIVASLYLSFVFAIQRLHDLNKSGWLSILMIVPLINLILILFLWFAPGTKGANDFGLPPPANTTVLWLVALIMPALFILGIVAAIALPAYQDYVTRVEQAQQQ